MTNMRHSVLVTLVASVLLAGCSLVLQTDKKQCKRSTEAKDCLTPYVCGDQGLCEEQTGCQADSDCRHSGICVGTSVKKCVVPECSTTAECNDGFVCNTTTRRCINKAMATCSTKDDCAAYDDAKVCLKSKGLCGASECMTNVECMGVSPTAQCVDSACEDPTWGCLGVKDVRKDMSASKMATLKIKVLYAFAQGGAKETGVANIDVRVCQFPDQQCANPKTMDWSYGADNYLFIKGLESGLNYRVQIKAKHPTMPDVDLLPAEYLMYRTVVSDTTEPKPILMFEDGVRDMLATLAEVNVDKSLGLLLTRIYDCTDTEVAGVVMDIGTRTTGCMGNCPTTVFYQNTSNLPDPGATQTNSAGRAGIVNLKTDVFNRITLTRAADNKKITSFVITPHAGWVTYVHFWPWDFGTAAD